MMKKIYVGVIALITNLAVSAQTIGFESTILPSNSYNNGSDLSGGFTYDGIHFSNYYDTTYAYNTGFSISNVVDNTTPGWGNQYSAITGSGFNSNNYAIFYPSGNIDLTSNPKYLESMRITNSTYAALSMKNGDAVGKKFGSATDANGMIDGTNGEDFLKLNIYSLNLSGDTLATIEFYLADYRFSDSTQDYIVENWETVDLTSLNVVGETIAYVVFGFESSDVGMWGINTPTYFAMDDFTYSNAVANVPESNISKVWKAYPNPTSDELYIEGVEGKVFVQDLTGKIVFNQENTSDIQLSHLPSGYYTLIVEEKTTRYTKRIIKL
jgi:hypothetical protein